MVLITSFVKLNKFPVSRCLFVMQEIRLRALARDAAMIAELAGRGAAKAQETLSLDMRQQSAPTTQFPPEAKELDQLVDYGVNGIDSYCNAQIRLFRGEDRGSAAQRVKHELLPRGVRSVTSLPFADQHEQVDALLERAASPELSADVALLAEMPVLLERLRVINEKYGAALLQGTNAPTRQEVRDEHRRCQELLAETMALIFGYYALQPPERQVDRDYLLEPIVRQNEAIRARRRRRRQGGEDAEPVTDPPLPAPGDLAPAPANDQDEPVESVA
jgi:hypothetical protein